MSSESLISLLYRPVQDIARTMLRYCEQCGLDVQIPITGAVRCAEDQIRIYGGERWTLHYVGLALDVEPILRVSASEWKAAFNAWPWWDLLQKDIAVEAGFDLPQDWQLGRDRPHSQVLFGCAESVLKLMWYSSGGNLTEIWHYLDTHVRNGADNGEGTGDGSN